MTMISKRVTSLNADPHAVDQRLLDVRYYNALKDDFDSLFGTDGTLNLGSSAVPIALADTNTRALEAYTTSALTDVAQSSLTIKHTQTVACPTATHEVAQFVLTSAVKLGNWANAVSAKIDLSTTGYVTGLAGVVCAELDLPTTNPTGSAGTYTIFEGELNVPTGYTSGVPVSFINLNAWGGAVAYFQTSGFVFDITGLGTPTSSKIIQANTDQATHALRIRVDGTPYFLLMTTANNGTE